MYFFVSVFTQWQLQGEGSRFTVIESQHISLYAGKDTSQPTPPSFWHWNGRDTSEWICTTKCLSIQNFCLYYFCSDAHTVNQVSGLVAHLNVAHFSDFIVLWLHPTDESAMVAGDVEHIPQTAASHSNTKQSSSTVDMLREDPRDVLYQGERHVSVSFCFTVYSAQSNLCSNLCCVGLQCLW